MESDKPYCKRCNCYWGYGLKHCGHCGTKLQPQKDATTSDPIGKDIDDAGRIILIKDCPECPFSYGAFGSGRGFVCNTKNMTIAKTRKEFDKVKFPDWCPLEKATQPKPKGSGE